MFRRSTLPLLGILCFCIAFSACSSTGESTNLTPEAKLPPEYATAWRSWYENDERWPVLRPTVRSDAALANFFVDNLLRVMVKHYDVGAVRAANQLPGQFERSRRELVYLGDYSAPVCTELVFTADGVVSFLAGDLLLAIDQGRWTLPFAQHLKSQKPEDRRRAADWLARLPHAGDDEEAIWQLLAQATQDPEWFVRAQIISTVGARSLATGSMERARPLLLRALADSDGAVVIAACSAIEATRDRRAIPALIQLMERFERGAGELRALKAAQAALMAVTGESTDRSAAGWREWWRKKSSAEGVLKG